MTNLAYDEDYYLMLSGIQHFYFCKRQWGLIHLEQQWKDNEATVHGQLLLQKADNPLLKEKRHGVIISRAVHIVSKELGLYGIMDVLELHSCKHGIRINGHTGFWAPNIVEYKRGKPKKDLRDIVQLIAQVLCLEETFECRIKEATLYYHAVNQRVTVPVTEDLRNIVRQLAADMHTYYRQKQIPKAEYFKNCKLCSLVDVCLPRLSKKGRNVENYIEAALKSGVNE